MTTPSIDIDNPLPQAFATDFEGIGGVIKTQPEDFLVDEIPAYDPCGEGEHLYLGIQKRGVSHVEMLSHLQRTFGVPRSAIGFAGMKDRRAITRQQVSIHLHDDPPSLDIAHEYIDVLWAKRHKNKLRRGHLAGNRFSIRIREVDPLRVPAVLTQLRTLQSAGLPAYFGSQRFGYRRNNHLLGRHLILGAWTDVLDELLGTSGTEYPEYQQTRREQYDAGDFAGALAAWTPADRAEMMALRSLVRGMSPKQTVTSLGRTTLSFWVCALQSAIYNRVLDRRLADGTAGELVEGDLAWKHDSRAVFAVTADDVGAPDLLDRIKAMEISPSGPLWGNRMTKAGGQVAEVEAEALAAAGLTEETLCASRFVEDGRRRPLTTPLSDPHAESGVDEEGPFIRVAFDLARGIYATIALREIMKTEGP